MQLNGGGLHNRHNQRTMGFNVPGAGPFGNAVNGCVAYVD